MPVSVAGMFNTINYIGCIVDARNRKTFKRIPCVMYDGEYKKVVFTAVKIPRVASQIPQISFVLMIAL